MSLELLAVVSLKSCNCFQSDSKLLRLADNSGKMFLISVEGLGEEEKNKHCKKRSISPINYMALLFVESFSSTRVILVVQQALEGKMIQCSVFLISNVKTKTQWFRLHKWQIKFNIVSQQHGTGCFHYNAKK